MVVLVFKGHQGQPELFDGGKGFHPEQMLFEQTDETLGTAIAFGLSNETGRGLDAQESQLALEIVGDIGRERNL